MQLVNTTQGVGAVGTCLSPASQERARRGLVQDVEGRQVSLSGHEGGGLGKVFGAP